MIERSSVPLADLTTLRVGGPVARVIEAESEAELIAAVAEADDVGVPVLLLGGGSNLVPHDEPYPGVAIRDAREEIADEPSCGCGGVTFRATAGTSWDALVSCAVGREWRGLEALAGIPGTVGAAPVQNIGAYGQEIADTLASVRVWDRRERRVKTFAAAELGFGYRTSILKRDLIGPSPARVVLDVTFQAVEGDRSAPIRYAQLAGALGVELGETAPMTAVRDAVLALRRSKGMVLDGADHDTWSAGSFFTNPVLSPDDAARLPKTAPRYESEGGIKTSAAWLISNAGLARGWGLNDRATLSTKHSLALTNRGSASAADIRELAKAVVTRVRDEFGVTLAQEPIDV